MTTKKLLLNDLNYLRLKQKQCMGKPEKTGQSVENHTTICFWAHDVFSITDSKNIHDFEIIKTSNNKKWMKAQFLDKTSWVYVIHTKIDN